MTGGSLGLRTGSYGSLQQHMQNSVALSIQSPSSGRKQSKMLPSGVREKEKLLPWTSRILQCLCRFVPRRKIGMLFVLVLCTAMALVTLNFLFSKGGYVPEGPDTNHDSPVIIEHVVSPVFQVPPTIPGNVPPTIPGNNGQNIDVLSDIMNTSVTYADHPCKNFSVPPPPSDRKRTGPRPCPVCYVPVEHAIALMPKSPSISPILKNLSYVSEEGSIGNESNRGSSFGGHPSLEQRNDSFNIRESMTVHCGFVKRHSPGNGTGFDIDGEDLLEMEQCRGVVVASAIFGNYDIIQQPRSISEAAKRSVCFFMFVDEETEAYIKNSSKLDSMNKVGLWRVVVVRNLPYADARRNGKVPKLLLHRIFPNARFSLWIDGKLELTVDPYLILERFLWRKNASFAISRHYRRFDVFVEAEANKAAGKYDNASIDYQIEFYKHEGLTPYSEAKLPITSDVPEGCVIIREHTPITNLFTCLWFNEVDRFTSRDQLSFSTVRDNIRSKVNWTTEMFMDCERRNFVVQAYHRDVWEQMMIPAASSSHPLVHPPPPPVLTIGSSPLPKILSDRFATTPVKRPPVKHGRERRAGSRRRRPRVSNDRDSNSI